MKFYYAGKAKKIAAISRGGWRLPERRALGSRGRKIEGKAESGFSSKRVDNIIFCGRVAGEK